MSDNEKEIARNIKKKFDERNKQITKDSSSARTQESIQHSLTVSRNRTINAIYSISKSNEWDYFVTLTFNDLIVNASDYEQVTYKLSEWLHNLKKRYAPNLKYLIVPELHKDGARYHFHGLLANCGNISFIDSGHTTFDNEPIYNILNYKFGYTTATKVKDNDKICHYLTKYITKDLCVLTANKKRYWNSRNCQKPIEEKYLLSAEEIENIMNFYVDNVAYAKTVTVPIANNSIKYIELTD